MSLRVALRTPSFLNAACVLLLVRCFPPEFVVVSDVKRLTGGSITSS